MVAMLYIIGIGLSDEKDITIKGLEAVKKCDKVYLESYTSKLVCDISALESLYGKKVVPVDRAFVEGAEQLLAEAKQENVALLIIGDALSATTHWDLLQRAKEIQTTVIHNASIFTAIAETGLQLYKFGKTTSIPFEQTTETPYNILKENQSIGAHTLLLLDLRPQENKYMTVNEAIEFMLKIEDKRKEAIITEETTCIGVARLGSKDQFIRAGRVKELLSIDFGKPVHALIVPGKLHFVEEEAMEQLRANL